MVVEVVSVSWWQLKGILDSAKAEIAADIALGPLSCPLDGELLEIRDGIRNCPMGNFRWEG